jgi:predicted dehydrogenase
MLVIPTPIPLHAEMHRAGVEAGVPVYLEKPPTLDPVELESMIAVDKKAKKKTFVGFNFIVEPQRQALKSRILSGEFGKILRGDLMSHWPRAKSYYERANWAGRLELNGQLILDSPLGNAMAHQVHNLFFWLGSEKLFDWAQLKEVKAECYRAHPIQGVDTVFVRGATTDETEFRITMSHAVSGSQRQSEIIHCEKAVITWILHQHFEIQWNDGRVEKVELQHAPLVDLNHLKYYEYLRGEIAEPMTTLVDSKPFVLLNNLIYVSSGKINSIPTAEIEKSSTEKNGKTEEWTHWSEMENLRAKFFQTGEFPSAVKPWAVPGKSVTPSDVAQLPKTIEQMISNQL